MLDDQRSRAIRKWRVGEGESTILFKSINKKVYTFVQLISMILKFLLPTCIF
jgi:hypothetical protein